MSSFERVVAFSVCNLSGPKLIGLSSKMWLTHGTIWTVPVRIYPSRTWHQVPWLVSFLHISVGGVAVVPAGLTSGFLLNEYFALPILPGYQLRIVLPQSISSSGIRYGFALRQDLLHRSNHSPEASLAISLQYVEMHPWSLLLCLFPGGWFLLVGDRFSSLVVLVLVASHPPSISCTSWCMR